MYVSAADGTRLYVEEAGGGTPILFIHEFAGSHAAWEPQMRFFSRRHRCIAYAARGYPPSDVPADPDRYSQAIAVDDARAVLDGLGVARAHIVGLSMGGYATVHVGITHPDRALSLTIAGAGYGSELSEQAAFRAGAAVVAEEFERLGARAYAAHYGAGPGRTQFRAKDPRGWHAFIANLACHSDVGAANTMRRVQGRRPSLFELEDALRRVDLPALIMCGDEDLPCLVPSLFLKRTMPRAGLAILPQTGHTLNLEEPAAFNALLAEFIAQAEAGRWPPPDIAVDIPA